MKQKNYWAEKPFELAQESCASGRRSLGRAAKSLKTAHTYGTQFFHFHTHFHRKVSASEVHAPQNFHAPLREILDPPLLKVAVGIFCLGKTCCLHLLSGGMFVLLQRHTFLYASRISRIIPLNKDKFCLEAAIFTTIK